MFYFSQLQMSIKFRKSWLKIIMLNKALTSIKLMHYLYFV